MKRIDRVFELVAELLNGADPDAAQSPLKTYDDFVIALSLDTGLTRREVRNRLSRQLGGDAIKRHGRPPRVHNNADALATRKLAAERGRSARLH